MPSQRIVPLFQRLQSAVFAMAVVLSGPASATPAKEAPWLPEAAAYRLTLFLGNLAPEPWDQISEVWTKPYAGSSFAASAVERLAGDSALTPDAVLAAIAAQDRAGLFAAATRLTAGRMLEQMDRAAAAPGTAGAQQAIAEAQGLYRAFADDLAVADPAAARTLGRAWLQLVSSAGSAGVLGAGATAHDAEGFAAAAATITEYITANYMPGSFQPRAMLSAIPESVIAAGTPVDLPHTLPPGSNIFDQNPLPRLVLNFEEQGISETDLPLVAYGDMLFDSAQIFGAPAQDAGIACSTCHNRSDINNGFFIPGISHQPGAADVDGTFFNPLFNDRRADSIDIPSLRGLRFTGPYGRDGRLASLRDFTRNVIVNEFAGAEPTPFMLDALVAYMTEFDFLPNSRLSAGGQLVGATEAEARGEVLFKTEFAGMDGMACATCHTPSGNFLDGKSYDIGSVAESYGGARTGTLNTPTLLGSRFTAPYFHDGSQPTLASVVTWFNNTKNLGLTDSDEADLTAYLEAVGDADEPYQAFDDRNTGFRLAFDELTTFASTLNTLLPARDAQHTLLLVDTVAADLAVDASTMGNLAARPEIYALADLLEEVGTAVRADDWTAAEVHWVEFKRLQSEIDGRIY